MTSLSSPLRDRVLGIAALYSMHARVRSFFSPGRPDENNGFFSRGYASRQPLSDVTLHHSLP